MARRKSKKSTISVDFSGVESRKSLPVGRFPMVLENIESKETSNGDDKLTFKFKIEGSDSPAEGSVGYLDCILLPQSLWKLKNTLEALQIEVEDDMELDLEEIVDTAEPVIGVVVENRDPQYANQLKQVELGDAAILDEDEEEEEEAPKKASKSAPKSKAKASKKQPEPEEEDEADDEITEDAINEADEDDLQDIVLELSLDVDLDDRKLKTLKKKRAAVLEAFQEAQEEDESDDESDDEEDLYDIDEVNAMGTAALQKIIDDQDLDIELSGASTKKKRKLVIDELRDLELLDE